MRYQHLRSLRTNFSRLHAPDRWLVLSLSGLILGGLFALASASSVYSFQRFGHAYQVFLHQLLAGGVPGAVLLLLTATIDYHRWQRSHWWLLVVTLGLLLSVFIPGVGTTLNRSRSWIDFSAFTLQPVEIVKLTSVVFLAAYLSQVGFAAVRSFRRGFLPFLAWAGALSLLIGLQPDYGSLLVVLVILTAVYFSAGAPARHLLYLGGLAACGMLTLWLSGSTFAVRLSTFLNPGADPQGVGYHISQAYLAIGSGGWFGRGLGKSHQKFAYLPEVWSDSIFAVIAEELGFFAAAALVGLLFTVVVRAIAVAAQAPDPFGRLLAVGIGTWLGFQGFLNIAVMVGLAPLTGVPLPFVSAGGTAFAANLAAVGLLVNISRQTKKM